MTDPAHRQSWDDALLWAARLQAPDFDDWDAHIAWLEADPAHPALYQRAALAMSAGLVVADRVAPTALPAVANDIGPQAASRPRRGFWLGAGAALAASLTALLVLPQRGAGPDLLIRTPPGVTRAVALADGTAMVLNGDTMLKVKSADQRQVVLERGEVFLRVVHDTAHPFALRVGDRVFQDVGTAFNVSVEPGRIRLAVAEGAVAVDPGKADVRVNAGEAVTISGSEAAVSQVPANSVGSWRSGRLVYADAELRQVASDLSRSFGVPVTVAPPLATRRFTGVLPLHSPPGEVMRQLADLLGVTASPTRSGWALTEGSHRASSSK